MSVCLNSSTAPYPQGQTPHHRSLHSSAVPGPATSAQLCLWSWPSVSALATLLSLIPQGNGLWLLTLQAFAGTEPST